MSNFFEKNQKNLNLGLQNMREGSKNMKMQKEKLKKTKREYDNLTRNNNLSSRILINLKKVHNKNVLYVYLCFYFLIIVCTYIFFKRILFHKIIRKFFFKK